MPIKSKLPALLSSFIVSFHFFSNAFADTGERQQIIQKELNCVSRAMQQNLAVTWADVCYAGTHSVNTAVTREDVMDTALAKAVSENSDYPAVKLQKFVRKEVAADAIIVQNPRVPADTKENSGSMLADMYFQSDDKPRWSLELGPEIYYYKYTERIGVKDTGTFHGMFFNYTYRISQNQPIHSLGDIFSDANKVNMFRLEGRAATGLIDYEGSGTWDGIRDIVGEIRGLAGYDIPVTEQVRITPFSGVGYRYLFDDFSSVPDRTIDGVNYYSGYDRESDYTYIPLGLEAEKKLSEGWSIQATAEYDFFLVGHQKSHFEDEQFAGDNPGFETLKNKQKHGSGFRVSARLTKETGKLDFFVEPYFRYWHIKDSEIDFVTINGQLLCDEDDLCDAGLEPDNKTRELGVKVGVSF